MRQEKEKNLLPLVLDLTNPSPALGWANTERDSFGQRGPVDMVFALALIHHLAISNNVPLPRVAEFFASAGKVAGDRIRSQIRFASAEIAQEPRRYF